MTETFNIELVAQRLLGPCEARTSDSAVYNGGALVIDVVNNRFIDSARGETGSAIALVMRVRGIDEAQAHDWITGALATTPPRLPPELFMERELIGLMLLQPSVIASLEDEVLPEDFVFGLHGAIYEKLRASADVHYDPGLPRLIEMLGGNTAAVVAPGYTLAQYIAHLAARTAPTSDPFAAAYALAREISKQKIAEKNADAGIEREPEYLPYESRYGAVRWTDIEQPGPAIQWIIKGMSPLGEAELIAGPHSSGKSFFTIDKAMHVARGITYMGRRTKQMGVVYCFWEAGSGAHIRLRAYKTGHDVPDGDLPFIALCHPPQIFRDEKAADLLAQEVIELTRDWPVPLGVVIVDTHNAATRGSSEVSSEDISLILQRYDTLRKATGASLWVVGHTNSSGAHRGNEQVVNSFATVSFIKTLGDRSGIEMVDLDDRPIREVRIAKVREGQAGMTWRFVLRKVQIGSDEDGDPITSCVIDDPNIDAEAMEQQNLPTRAAKRDGFYLKNDAEIKIFKAVLSVITAQGVVPPSDMKLPANVIKVAKWSDVCNEYRRTEPVAAGDSEQKHNERIKSRLRRAQQKLHQFNVIGIDRIGGDADGYHVIWPTGRRVEGAGFSWPPRAKVPDAETTEAAKPDEVMAF